MIRDLIRAYDDARCERWTVLCFNNAMLRLHKLPALQLQRATHTPD